MPERERIQKQKTTTERSKEVEDVQPAKADEALAEELDELLEEIDSVLEENDEGLEALLDEIDGVLEQDAEAFVKNYIQKGGELCETIWYNIREGFCQTKLRILGGFSETMQNRWL